MDLPQHLQKDDIKADRTPTDSAGKTDVQTLTDVTKRVLPEVLPGETSSPTVSGNLGDPHADAPISNIGLQGVADTDAVMSTQALVANTHPESNGEFDTVKSSGPAQGGSDPNLEIVLPDGGKFDDVTAEDDIVAAELQAGVGSKKKKKKKKPKSKRGLKNPTGFEEYYVDAPVTPAEFEEEKGMYHGRIEKAIQRYVAKRNLDSTRKNMFDKYLVHGGIDAGPKMFSGGLDAQALGTLDADDIATLTATNFVPFDKQDPRNEVYVVDFEGCIKAFLSSQVRNIFDLTSEAQIKYLVGIIRNFLNYLLHHDVCPEYQDQINASRRVCDQAEKELWNIVQAQSLLPGDFNKACSEIFGGIFKGMCTDSQDWATGTSVDCSQGLSPALARKVFKISLIANATEEVLDNYQTQSQNGCIRIVNTEDTGLEVTEIILCQSETLSLYADPRALGLKPLGKMKAKTWFSPNAAREDLTVEEEEALQTNSPQIKDYEFWIEDEVLLRCFVGMKLVATVTELSIGITYFDAMFGIHCSFFDILPNEQMMGWREPEKEWLPMRGTNTGREGDVDGDVNEACDNGEAIGGDQEANDAGDEVDDKQESGHERKPEESYNGLDKEKTVD